jgi:hypothetical protein
LNSYSTLPTNNQTKEIIELKCIKKRQQIYPTPQKRHSIKQIPNTNQKTEEQKQTYNKQ